MSARSRALNDLADHCMKLSRNSDGSPYLMPIYTGTDLWEQAADMARRTALEERWRERIARKLRLRIWEPSKAAHPVRRVGRLRCAVPDARPSGQVRTTDATGRV